MNLTFLYRVTVGACLLNAAWGIQSANADLLSDSKVSGNLRNFYYHRDLQAGSHDLNEWAQGIALTFQSGYTDGIIGLGLDATGWLGVKLDSAAGSSGTGILPKGSTGEAPDDYSRLGLTAKIRYSNTVIRVGSHTPKIPLLASSDARLLPQTFNGATVESREVKGLLVTAGAFDRTVDRAQAGADKMTLSTFGPRDFGLGAEKGQRFRYVGTEYKLTPELLLRAYYGGLQDYYKQTFLGANYSQSLGGGQSVGFDLRYFQSTNDGTSNLREVDNKTFGGMVTYGLGGHTFGVGLQRVTGDTGFTYIAGTDAYVVNSVQWGNFSNKEEQSWQLKYTYDFASVGAPGLSLMTRYLKGTEVAKTDGANGEEWERNTDLSYVVQAGRLKNLSLTLRNATYRSDFNAKLDETRFIVNYPFSIF
ncbi:OprD family porin [Pseudomonas syringae]|uniref:Outer membrane porin n=1 Tax=Pseudomonas syringae pv. aceris TaxID=199198 RepID=A0A0L8IPY3_PSESX|nr:OprD family porin [Pseudomonas syringae]EGH71539.1 outer membrane porin [Pseudomonas syringae pv. aceris str. M302273]KOG03496.1 Outer membrane porin [Pseudomonas syringae pv. aceris]KPW09203.1 Outer membrane porin [Pseudomonas syringae pv. aceris]